MPRIDRYILGQMLSLFGFLALVLVSIYWINRAVGLFDDLLSDGQTALVVLEFTALTLPLVIAAVLPLAGFAAAAYGAHRMAGESELVAMQAAGLSPWRLARPVLVFGLLIGLMVAVLVHGLVPAARARLADRQAELAQNVTERFLRPGSFRYPAEGITLFIRDIAADGRLLDLFIEDARDPANQTINTAKEALLVRGDAGPVLILLRGMSQTLRQAEGGPRLSVIRFDEFSYDLAAIVSGSGPGNRDLRDYGTLRLLRPDPALLAATGASPAEALREAHQRIAQPLLSPVAATIGFATLLIGGYSRLGVWRQVLGAVLLLILIQLLADAAANQAGRDPAMWPVLYAPILLGAAIAAGLLWLAARPRRPARGSQAGGRPA